MKEKTNTWMNYRESVKRESEMYKMVEQAAIDEIKKEACLRTH